MIREYNSSDIKTIELICSKLHNNFRLSLNTFSKCLLYEINNKIVGVIIYSIIYDRAELVDIIIVEEYRNKGYAKKLIKYMIDDCKDCNNITLEVNVNNKRAISLYENCGFKIVSIRKKYYGNEDAYLMER